MSDVDSWPWASPATQGPSSLSLPNLGQTLGTNILAGVLDASNQVGNKLMDGSFILNSPRHPLGHLDFVCFTAGRARETWVKSKHG